MTEGTEVSKVRVDSGDIMTISVILFHSLCHYVVVLIDRNAISLAQHFQ